MKKTILSFKWHLLGLVCLGVGVGIYFRGGDEPLPKASPSLSLAEVMGGDAASFAQAIEPRNFEFPKDHGPHPEFRTEWWYFTGNLQTPQGRHFGYQFTLFRSALASEPVRATSQWATNQVYMGHFAVTDTQAEKFYHFERFSRGAVELAGAQTEPFRVWLENWSVSSQGASFFPLEIKADAEEIALTLTIEPAKALVLQGTEGLSQKGHQRGNASYYYSFTRLNTNGQLQVGGKDYALAGFSWMDREWSTSALEENQVGWDWFALQLSNGWDLMFYQLRLNNGQPDTTSSGILVDPQGQTSPLNHQQLEVQTLQSWKSPSTDIRYPSQWKLTVPEQQIVLTLKPRLAQQELQNFFTYWEGAVDVQGQFQSQAVSGQGYVEMTGYPKEEP